MNSTYYENVDRIRAPNINPYSRVEYRAGLYVGYRGYEKNNVEPLFPFGFGLSYTQFEYSDISVVKEGNEAVVTFDVTNTGKVAGAEVAQVYVSDDESSIQRPIKELKGFDKVFLEPGESRTLSIRLGDKSFRFYDPYLHRFVLEDGSFTISVGASVADIRLTASVNMEFLETENEVGF